MHERGHDPTDVSDEVLARRVQRGDRDALDSLVRRYLRAIHAVTVSYLAERADIEDAVQETFLRALNRIAAYEPTRPFAPWLYQIARNVGRDRLAASVRRRTEPLHGEGIEAPAPGPEIMTERAEIRHAVDAAILQLPEQRRTAFRLHDVDGYTTNEIAGIMDLSPGTIRSHVHHARRALRQALAHLREPKAPKPSDVDEPVERGEVESPSRPSKGTAAIEAGDAAAEGRAGSQPRNARG